ncbi:hypothetical protein ASC87_24395 [Rhizobacter sp. Root1221]|nr:hypothetical protein ASC87_24395 [Rhizobacter sp. Root1221]
MGPFVQDEVLRRPHVQEFLSIQEVRELLAKANRRQLAGMDVDSQIRSRLCDLYSNVSGEDARHAVPVIDRALGAIYSGQVSQIKDGGTAAMLQAGISEITEKIDQGSRLKAAELLSEETADRELTKIIERRHLVGEPTLQALGDLLTGLPNEQRLGLASTRTRITALNWAIRLYAAHGKVDEAQAALRQLEELGHDVETIPRAFLDAATGKLDQALGALDTLGTAESRTILFALLLNNKREAAARQYLEGVRSLGIRAFTATGWFNAAQALTRWERYQEALAHLTALSTDQYQAAPALSHLRAVLVALELIPKERHRAVLDAGHRLVLLGTVDSSRTPVAREEALQLFTQAAENFRRLHCRQGSEGAELWLAALRLSSPTMRAQEITRIQVAMKDPLQAIDLVELCFLSEVEFDPEPLARHLARREVAGGLSSDERVAKLLLLKVSGAHQDLLLFARSQWNELRKAMIPSAVVHICLTANIAIGDLEQAEHLLADLSADLDEAELRRFRLMLADRRGSDPSEQALKLFRETDELGDLHNLVVAFTRAERWGDLVEFSGQLFTREPRIVNAIHHLRCLRKASRPPREISAFIESVHLPDEDDAFRLEEAWNLFALGRCLEAQVIVDDLVRTSDGPEVISLDMNLAIQSGDWSRFSSISERTIRHQAAFHSSTLLTMANVVSLSDTEHAVDLLRQAVAKAPDNPDILLGAYVVSVRLGREAAGSVFLQGAMQARDRSTSIQSFTFRQTVEMLASQHETLAKRNEDLRSGSLPLHLAAAALNTTLMHMLVAVPMENAEQGDARKRRPVPFRSGRRQPAQLGQIRFVAFDITTLIVLHRLDRLGAVFGLLDCVVVPSGLFLALLEENQRSRFHQPSKVTEARALLRLVNMGSVKSIDPPPPTPLSASMGDEGAALLSAAVSRDGLFVHLGSVFDVNSYMDVVVDLGEMQSRVVGPESIAWMLHHMGIISDGAYADALQSLRQADSPTPTSTTSPGEVFLNIGAAEALHRANILQALITAARAVWVHPNAVELWKQTTDSSASLEPVQEFIDDLRIELRRHLSSGKLKLQETNSSNEDHSLGPQAATLHDLFAHPTQADAIAIDDRALNGAAHVENASGSTVPLLCSIDLLNALVADGTISIADFYEDMHKLRSWCLYFVPVDEAQLLSILGRSNVLSDGKVQETAHLRGLREYLARLRSLELFRSPDDFVFSDALWRTAALTIRALWLDESIPIPDAVAKCSWLVSHVMPSASEIGAAVRGDVTAALSIMAARTSVGLLPLSSSEERRDAQRDWTERMVLDALQPAKTVVIDRTVSAMADTFLVQAKKVINGIDHDRDATGPTAAA